MSRIEPRRSDRRRPSKGSGAGGRRGGDGHDLGYDSGCDHRPVRHRRSAAALTLALLVVALAGTAWLLAGCGAKNDVQGSATSTSAFSSISTLPETTSTTVQGGSTTTTTGTSAGNMTVSIYFSKGEKMTPVHRTLPKSSAVAAAAMRALLAGPTTQETQAGYYDSIPNGTTLLSVSVHNGVATVDLSKEYESGGGTLSMSSRLAQVVFTLTRFSSIRGVQFELDGKPIDVLGGEGIMIDSPSSRANFEEMSPAVLIESPVLGDSVRSPVRVRGTANTFEAVFRLSLVDSEGLILAEQSVKAVSGTGTRGTFDVTIPFRLSKAGKGTLIALVLSPKDGSRQQVAEVPIELVK